MNERIVGTHIILEPLEERHMPHYMQMLSPMVMHALHIENPAHEEEYIRASIMQARMGIGLWYAIINKQNGHCIGVIAIRERERGQLYSWLNEQFWGGGRYQEALSLISGYYFATTEHNHLWAQVDLDNQRSYKALLKAGFICEGESAGDHGRQYEMVLRKK